MSDSPRTSRFKLPTPQLKPRVEAVVATPESDASRVPKTMVGRILEADGQGFLQRMQRAERELAELKASGAVIVELDPKQIRLSAHANRHDRSLAADDPALLELKATLKRDGQIQPVTVRPINGASNQFEIVQGSRRHAAALLLDQEQPEGFKLKAVVSAEARDDRTLAMLMYVENAAREDLSAFETGAMFAHWITAGIFANQAEIAAATHRTASTIYRYMAVQALPDEVLDAFGDPRAVSLRWADELTKALRDRREAVLAKAKVLTQNPTPSPPDAVLRALVGAGSEASSKGATSREETVKLDGKVALRIKRKGSSISCKLGATVPAAVQKEFSEQLREWSEQWLKKKLGNP